MKHFINLKKDILSRMEVLQIKYIEKISLSMVKVNCYNKKTIHCCDASKIFWKITYK